MRWLVAGVHDSWTSALRVRLRRRGRSLGLHDDLIHEALKRTQQEDLERNLIAGLERGDPIEITPEYWEKKRRDLVERHARKNA